MINKYSLFFCLALIVNIISCVSDFGGAVILKPDEYKYIYEAKEKVILKAIADVFKEKNMGTNVTIDQKNLKVESDYLVSDDWRTKANASVKKLNWKECEVSLIMITEKKTETGWEVRQLLHKEQYDTFFSVIDLKIYEEMSKIE
jgi:hypothetical protein